MRKLLIQNKVTFTTTKFKSSLNIGMRITGSIAVLTEPSNSLKRTYSLRIKKRLHN